MSPNIRRAALRAAAKAAIVVSLGACGGSPAPAPVSPAPATPPNDGISVVQPDPTPAEQPCGAYLDGLATIDREHLAPDDPLRNRPDVYGPPFADIAARSAPRTQQCCTSELAQAASTAPHRWACCSALPGYPDGCTPWGPPCPPEMPVA